MKQIIPSLRTLRWRLTLQYMAVTLAVMLAAEMVIVVISQMSPIFSNPPAPVGRVQLVAQQAGIYFQNGTADRVEIASWLRRGVDQGFILLNPVSDTGSRLAVSLTFSFEADRRLLVVDRQAKLLAVYPPDTTGQPGPSLNMQSLPGLPGVMERMLAGETDARKLYARGPERFLVIGAPIRDANGVLQGGLLLYGTAVAAEHMLSLQSIVVAMMNGLIYFTLAAALIALVFGYLAARGLTRRLARLAQAAESWSQGDFSVFVKDNSGDEIGRLGRRLNRMAEQLSNLINTRRELASLQERNRLARDLHDSVKQQAFALSAFFTPSGQAPRRIC